MSSKPRRYSKVYRRVWNDEKFRRLSAPAPNGQSLWLRLLTGPELTNVPGLIVMGEAAFAEAMGWTLEGFREAFAEVSREGLVKADWKARLVWVPKAIQHNEPESPNVVSSWAMPWDEAPECALKDEAYQELQAFMEGKGDPWSKAFVKACGKPSGNQKQEQKQKQEQEERETRATPAPVPAAAAHLESFTRSFVAEAKSHADVAQLVSETRQAAGGGAFKATSWQDRESLQKLVEWSDAPGIGRDRLRAVLAAFWASKGTGARLSWLVEEDPGRFLGTTKRKSGGMAEARTATELAAEAETEPSFEEQLAAHERRRMANA